MPCTTIDHAISLICLAGQGAWLSKADITSTFKVLPIHPDYWHFFGILWKSAYYFAVCLTFGCKSSPKIFIFIQSTLLDPDKQLPYVIHLLDDLPTVMPPSPPHHMGNPFHWLWRLLWQQMVLSQMAARIPPPSAKCNQCHHSSHSLGAWIVQEDYHHLLQQQHCRRDH